MIEIWKDRSHTEMGLGAAEAFKTSHAYRLRKGGYWEPVVR